jgi:hypothetical protein
MSMNRTEGIRGFVESRVVILFAAGSLALAGCGIGNPFSAPPPRSTVVGAHVIVTEEANGSSIQIEDPDDAHDEDYPKRTSNVNKAVLYLQGLCGRIISHDDEGYSQTVSFGGQAANDACIGKVSFSDLP